MSSTLSSPTRRDLIAAAAGAGACGILSGSPKAATTASKDGSVRPFRFNASDEALADLRRRIAAREKARNKEVTRRYHLVRTRRFVRPQNGGT